LNRRNALPDRLQDRRLELRRINLALTVLAVLAASPAFAQYSAVITACRWDATHVCGGVAPGGGQLSVCIKANFAKLGASCKAALVGIAAVREACAADIQAQCPTAKPGAGHILLCVKAHYATMSEPCREAIGQAAERNLRALRAAGPPG
jgi:hypothetical protein